MIDRRRPSARGPHAAARGQFEDLTASVLHCHQCQGPQPVRERLLLILPDGELHEYVCTACGSSLGKRRVSAGPPALAE